jgi:hypothetical protein
MVAILFYETGAGAGAGGLLESKTAGGRVARTNEGAFRAFCWSAAMAWALFVSRALKMEQVGWWWSPSSSFVEQEECRTDGRDGGERGHWGKRLMQAAMGLV